MNKLLTFVMISMFMLGIGSVYAYDADTPYTVTINYIIGADTSFTVELAGEETTIDFNPATIDSKEVEPDSQVALTNTSMLTITNTGNVNLDFPRAINATNPAWAVLSMNTVNTTDWTQLINDTFVDGDTAIAPASESNWFFWANFTDAVYGTDTRLLQINSTQSA